MSYSRKVKRELKHFESGEWFEIERNHFEDIYHIKLQDYTNTIKQICLNKSEFKQIIKAFYEINKEANA